MSLLLSVLDDCYAAYDPAFSLAFTRMMMKEEKFSGRVVIGSVLVVVGVAMVALL